MSFTPPAFYRIWFTLIDPLFSILGIYSNIFTPSTILLSYSPTYRSPPTSETILCLDTVAAFLSGLIFLQVYLLRAKANDITVWRAVQGSTLIVDIGLLAAFARALGNQGRLGSIGGWRVEEWGNYAITVGVAIVRGAFLMEVGMGKGTKKV
ncbi:hypothetical protein MMC22_011711 [Lobaria immixta]|nr:hypothetical protein [Lobaria immixta]